MMVGHRRGLLDYLKKTDLEALPCSDRKAGNQKVIIMKVLPGGYVDCVLVRKAA